jgi:ABC-type branched-subunit amino acid transport system permease subunit
VAAALILAPLGVGRVYSAYYLNLLTWILIFALFAAALDLALGYGGLVSFGHAGFFGAGAYGAALALRHVAFSLWAALLIGIAAARSWPSSSGTSRCTRAACTWPCSPSPSPSSCTRSPSSGWR